MGFTEELRPYFQRRVRDRGTAYFADGLVKIAHPSEPDHFAARVKGSSQYDVAARWQQKAGGLLFLISCTCPYCQSHQEPCKHMWATVLAAQEQKRLPKLRRSDWIDFIFSDGDDPSLLGDQDEEAEETAAPPVLRLPLPAKVPSRQGKETPPAAPALDWLTRWKQQYSGMTRPVPPAATPICPFYKVEAAPSYEGKGITLSLAHQTMTASGKPGQIKPLTLLPEDLPRIEEFEHQQLCRLLVGAGQVVAYGYVHSASSWRLRGRIALDLLPKLAATGRLLLRREQYGPEEIAGWDDQGSWDLGAAIEPLADGKMCHLRMHLRRGDVIRPVDEKDRFYCQDPALLLRGNLLAPVEIHGCWDLLASGHHLKPMRFQRQQLPQVLEKMAASSLGPPLTLAPELEVRQVRDLQPQPEAWLEFPTAPSMPRAQVQVATKFTYGGSPCPASLAPFLLRDDGAVVDRKLDLEEKHLARLSELGVRQNTYGEQSISGKAAPSLATTLIAEGWRVYGNKKLYRTPGRFDLNISSGVDWFEIQGGCDFDGQLVSTPRLLAALRKGNRFVVLDDGTLGMLPEQWLNRHGHWLDLAQTQGDALRFSRNQLPLLDLMLDQLPEIHVDSQLEQARRQLAGFAGVQPVAAPPGFVGDLRNYQCEGLGWLEFLDRLGWGGCLADDMGLGKTIQLLALLLRRRQDPAAGPSLVVAPKSLIFNWAREAKRFAPQLKVLDYTGITRGRLRDRLGDAHLVLTTYGTMLRDIKHLTEEEFDYVVLDEAQAIKNPDSQSAKAARLLRARRRLALTGTPVQNNLGDLWSIFEFLNPGMLGALPAFKSAAGLGRQDAAPAAELEPLRRALRPFILRRTKAQVLADLPERTEQTIFCQMGKVQAALYAELREHYRASLLGRVADQGMEKSTFQVLEALLRLRQAACHPGLLDPGHAAMESAKFESLLPMLVELIEEGHKALVFSQFTSLLKLLQKELSRRRIRYEYLDGKTKERQLVVDHFQTDPDCPLMLISLKAGGVGLNLTAADYVLILDPWWNPAAEAQAIDRAHRIGQQRHVHAYRLIAQGSVEEKILQLQQSKRDLADAIINQQNSLIASLTREDLADLLS